MTDNDTFLKLFLESWQEVREPIRPSTSELRFYESYVERISRFENPQMLILGSTPELRDMAMKHGLKSICADLGKPIWKAMKHFMKEQGEEEFLHCDWLQLPEERKYDLIIGDGPLNMLSREQGIPFFESIAKAAKDDGLMVLRIGTLNENLKFEDFDTVMRNYRKENFDINLYGYTTFFANNIGETLYPHLTQVELYTQVLSKYLMKEELEEIKPFLLDFRPYVPTLNDIRAMSGTHFLIDKVSSYDAVGYWGMGKQYVFRKKPSESC